MISEEIKSRILEAISSNRSNYPSDAKHAFALGISTSVYSALKKGRTEKSLSDANWLGIARRLGVSLSGSSCWKAARTATFEYVTSALSLSQSSSLSGILCDCPNIGKTFAAKHYVKTHRNAVYVDCSQVKTKTRLVRFIAREFGVSVMGNYVDVYEDLVFYLRGMDHPLVVLDEAGDLSYEAFLELKALWNATEGSCGWYMMGADGLSAKIDRSIRCRKVGFAELLSRYGGSFRNVSPFQESERSRFLMEQAVLVAQANAPSGVDAVSIARRSGGSLRRVYIEIEKLKKECENPCGRTARNSGGEK